MDTRKVLMLLAICALMSGLSGVAVASDQGMLTYEAADYSRSADPSWPAAQSDASQIREPVDTGSVPGESGTSGNEQGPDTSVPPAESGGLMYRPGIDDGP